MNKLLTVALLLSASALVADGADQNQLKLQITMTRGESSRDSHSVKTTIAISGQKLTYTQSYTGRLGSRPTEQREFDLTEADLKKITEQIKTRNLLVTESIAREGGPKGTYRWFQVRIQPVVDGATGLITIRASRKAVELKDERIYKDSIALIEEIYGILHRLDPDITYEPLIE